MSKPTLTTESFLENCILIHKDQYKYNITTDKVKAHQMIDIICNIHGPFQQRAFHHMRGAGCKKCGIEARAGMNSAEFKNKALQLSQIITIPYEWINCNKLRIQCHVHGKQEVSYYRVFNTKGCPLCRKKQLNDARRKGLVDYSERLQALYDGKYFYDATSFKGLFKPFSAKCPTHGIFTLCSLRSHLVGVGCPKCSPVSKVEKEWLAYLNVPDELHQRKIVINGKIYIVDAYDPATNTIYEFWGDFYHGNPDIHDPNEINGIAKKTFGELFENTMKKREDILKAGYKLVEIWENEFNKQKKCS